MNVLVVLIYEDGQHQEKEISLDSRRIYGAKIGGKRPVKAIIPSGFSKEFIANLYRTLHPQKRVIEILDK